MKLNPCFNKGMNEVSTGCEWLMLHQMFQCILSDRKSAIDFVLYILVALRLNMGTQFKIFLSCQVTTCFSFPKLPKL